MEIILFLVISKWHVSARICLDSGLEILQGLHGILVTIVRPGKLKAHIRLEETLVSADTLDEENTKLGLPLLDTLDHVLAASQRAVGRVEDANGTAAIQEVVQEFVQSLHRDLLAHSGSLLVLGVEELGGLVIRVVLRTIYLLIIHLRLRGVVQIECRNFEMGRVSRHTVRMRQTIEQDGRCFNGRIETGGLGRKPGVHRGLPAGRNPPAIAHVEDSRLVLLPR